MSNQQNDVFYETKKEAEDERKEMNELKEPWIAIMAIVGVILAIYIMLKL